MAQAKVEVGEAKQLLIDSSHGFLATHSVDVAGYPFGSVVPYCLDHSGQPVILISGLAQHTKNIKANPKVSLTIAKGAEDVQSEARLTYIADAEDLGRDNTEIADRYFKRFPNMKELGSFGDFSFFRLNLVRGRYIAGFGKIYWIERDQLLNAN